MKSSVFSWLACALLLTALLVYIGPMHLLKPPAGGDSEAMIGGDFDLVDSKGTHVRAKDFRDKYMLVYFGYTHCPDICPTTLLVMRNALERLPDEKQAKVVPVFITIDPERDTTSVMDQYVTNFGHRLVGLTGTPDQIKQAADAYHVYYSKTSEEGSAGGYLVDHSGFIYLMDKDGHYKAHFAHTISEGELASKLNQFVR